MLKFPVTFRSLCGQTCGYLIKFTFILSLCASLSLSVCEYCIVLSTVHLHTCLAVQISLKWVSFDRFRSVISFIYSLNLWVFETTCVHYVRSCVCECERRHSHLMSFSLFVSLWFGFLVTCCVWVCVCVCVYICVCALRSVLCYDTACVLLLMLFHFLSLFIYY